MAYEVHLDVYDGPFHLLLQLITAQQVDLYEVRLQDIVDRFLAELARLEALDLEVTTEFLLIASTLVELKCRRLLPGSADLDLDDELALFEARDYLLARLLECKMFSEAAQSLAALERQASLSHARCAGPGEEFAGLAPDLLEGVSAEQLGRVAARALGPKPEPVLSVSHVHDDAVTVGESIERLLAELPALGETTLHELAGSDASKAAFVALFLAVLELYKRELIEVEQERTFGEVRLRWLGEADEGAHRFDELAESEFDDDEAPSPPGHLFETAPGEER